MTRSLFLSLSLHLALLIGLVLLWPERPTFADPAQTLVTARQIKVDEKSKIPDLRGGENENEPVIEPVSIPEIKREPPPAASPKPVPLPTKKTNKTKKPGPQLLLPEPDYPTALRTERSMPADAGGPNGPETINLAGEGDSLNHPAIPYHHPKVTLAGVSHRDWILVEFEIWQNGAFRVYMLEGTGDIHRDARALTILRRWKWIPRKIDGEKVPSIEVIRLYKREEYP